MEALIASKSMLVDLKNPTHQPQKSNNKNSNTIFPRLNITEYLLEGPYKHVWAISQELVEPLTYILL